MHTITTDKQLRVRIPDAKPGQVFSYENNGDGSFLLVTVQSAKREPTAKLKKENGRIVVVPNQPINVEAIKELLAEFP